MVVAYFAVKFCLCREELRKINKPLNLAFDIKTAASLQATRINRLETTCLSGDASYSLFHFELATKKELPVTASLLKANAFHALSLRKCQGIVYIRLQNVKQEDVEKQPNIYLSTAKTEAKVRSIFRSDSN
jgi:hypothetical protein